MEKQYANYAFEFEFLLPAGGNNGLGIHYRGRGTLRGRHGIANFGQQTPQIRQIGRFPISWLPQIEGKRPDTLLKRMEPPESYVNGPLQVVLNGVEILNANLDDHQGEAATTEPNAGAGISVFAGTIAGQVQEH